MTDDVLISGNEREPRRWLSGLIPEGAPAAPEVLAPLRRDGLLALAALVLGAVGVLLAKAMGAETPRGVLVLGLASGLVYGGGAATVALVYRLSGVVALLALGLPALGLVVALRITGSSNATYWPVLLAVMALAGLISAGTGRVARNLSSWGASALTLAVALAATGLVFVVQSLDSQQALLDRHTSGPSGLPEWHVGQLLLSGSTLGGAGLALLAIAAVGLVSRGVPHGTTLAWALLGSFVVGEQVLSPALAPGFANDDVFVVLALAGCALMRPVLAAALGVVWGVVYQLGLWNTPHDDPLVWLAVAGVLVPVVANVRLPRPTLRPAAPRLAPGLLTEVPGLAVVVAGVVVLAIRTNHTDRAIGALGLAIGLLAVAQVLLASRPGVDLSLVVVMAAGGELAQDTGHDLFLAMAVAGLTGAALLVLLDLGTGRRAWSLTCAGAALTLLLVDQQKDFSNNLLDQPQEYDVSLLGHRISETDGEVLLVIAIALLSLVVARLALGRRREITVAAAGAVCGWAGLAYVQELATVSSESYATTAIVSVTAAAVAVTARSVTGALAVAAALTVVPYTLGSWWGHQPGLLAALSCIPLLMALLAPRLRRPAPSIG